MDKKKFKAILLLAFLILAIFFVFQNIQGVIGFFKTLWGILTPFILGICFAFILNVPMRFFEKKLLRVMDRAEWSKKLKRPLAMILVFVLVAAVVYLLLSQIVPELIRTVGTIINGIPTFIRRLDEWLRPYGFELSKYINASISLPSAAEMNAQLSDMIDIVLKGAAFSTSLIGSVYQNVLSTFFTIMFTIYFLFSKERLRRQIKAVITAYTKPYVANGIQYVARLTQHTFTSFITGQCLEAVILGGMFFLMMTIFKMPYVMLISMFIMVTALIPVIGAWLGCISGALLILMNDPMQALGFLAMFLVLQQIEGNVIYPKVMGNAIGLPSVWVLFAVVLGDGLMGVVGMLLFIPLTSVGYSLFRDRVHQRLRERQKENATEGEAAAPLDEKNA